MIATAMMIGKHNCDIIMKQTIRFYNEHTAFYLLPVDTSEFFCFMVFGEEEASSKCSGESDSFMHAGSLASDLTK